MRLKLRYALPAIQMVAVFLLLRIADAWEWNQMRHGSDMPEPGPTADLMFAINLPLMFFTVVFRIFPAYWDRFSFALIVGLFWFWVAVNIERWEAEKTLVTFRRDIPRIVSDFILIVNGIFIGAEIFSHGGSSWVVDRFVYGIRHPRLMFDFGWWPLWLWSVPCVALYVAWIAASIILPIRDLVQLAKSDG